jgi:branched-chain amino acid aminotransferase
MPPNSPQLWYDGALVASSDATTHVLTHSLHYGVAAIEGIRAYLGDDGVCSRIFRLGDHLRRLTHSCKSFRMTLPYSLEELSSAHVEVLRANRLPQAYLRPIAFLGPEKRGLLPEGAKVHVAIAAFEWDEYLGASAANAGIHVKTASFTRPSPSSLPSRAKVSSLYAVSMLAKMEATEDGYDEALLLDSEGYVAEASAENVFVVRQGQLIDAESPCSLLGITRDTVMTLARDRAIPVVSRRLTRDDVYQADEVFLTGTAAEIVPVVRVDRRTISDARPGPVTLELIRAYREAVRGRDERHRDWGTLVP